MRVLKKMLSNPRSAGVNIRKRFSRYLLSIIWVNKVPKFSHNSKTTHIDIGSGNLPRNTFDANFMIAIDLFMEPKVIGNIRFIKCDATTYIPVDDNSVDSISCYDFIEHVPRWTKNESDAIKFPFIEFMNEIHRCLKPGGVFYAITPAFPSGAAFQDPTHVNFISVKTIDYFVGSRPLAKELGYGFTGNFEMITQSWISVRDGFPRQSQKNWTISSKFDWNQIPLKEMILIFNPISLCRLFLSKKTHLLWVIQKKVLEEA